MNKKTIQVRRIIKHTNNTADGRTFNVTFVNASDGNSYTAYETTPGRELLKEGATVTLTFKENSSNGKKYFNCTCVQAATQQSKQPTQPTQPTQTAQPTQSTSKVPSTAQVIVPHRANVSNVPTVQLILESLNNLAELMGKLMDKMDRLEEEIRHANTNVKQTAQTTQTDIPPLPDVAEEDLCQANISEDDLPF